jgi:cobalt-zinc-cadmium efflux system outer membrane protein
MLRRRVGSLMAFSLWGCLAVLLPTGCAAHRPLARALRLSRVDLDYHVAEHDEEHIDSSGEAAESFPDDESLRAEVPSRESTASLPELAETRRESSSEKEDEHTWGQRQENLRPRKSRPLKPTASSDSRDDWAVLLTGYEDANRRSTPESVPPSPLAETVQPKSLAKLQVPVELPGSEAQGLHVPPFDPRQPQSERRESIQKLYPGLPELPVAVSEDPTRPRWTLAELESVAWENHPAMMQAAAQVEVARGAMIQAGLHPNPSVGYEGDTVNTLGTAGYHGPYITQQVVTGGKLKLAKCAAAMDYENAAIACQQTRIEIATRVRDAYYDLLVSQQRRKMLTALSRFTDEIYRAQIELVAGGQAAPYEPLQLRVFAVQARNAVADAHYSVIGAGRRLGAATGMTEAEEFVIDDPSEILPTEIDYHSAKAYLWENHTELRTVRNRIVQAQYLSRLEYIRPRIPDLNVYSTVQKDYTGPPFGTTFNLQVGAPIPVFDRNQGNILSTQSAILSQERAYASAQNTLAGRLAEILTRYDTARIQSVNYRQQMLPDQVRTYRGVYSRYREGGQADNDNLNFSDVIVAQQTLVSSVNGYAEVLNQMWQAYVDAGELLQVDELAQLQAWFGIGG